MNLCRLSLVHWYRPSSPAAGPADQEKKAWVKREVSAHKGLGFRIWGLGFGVQDLGFRV